MNARNSLNSSQLDLICKDYIRSSVAAASAISSRSAVPHTATPATHAHNKKEVTVSPRSIRTYATTAKTTTKLKLISAKPIVATPRKLVNTRNIGTIPFNFAPSGKPLNLQSTASVIKSLLTNPTVTPNLPTATTKSNSVTTPPQPKSSSNWGNFISNRQKMFTPYGNINPLLQSSSTTSKVDLDGIFQTSSTILKPNINPMPPSTSAPFTVNVNPISRAVPLMMEPNLQPIANSTQTPKPEMIPSTNGSVNMNFPEILPMFSNIMLPIYDYKFSELTEPARPLSCELNSQMNATATESTPTAPTPATPEMITTQATTTTAAIPQITTPASRSTPNLQTNATVGATTSTTAAAVNISKLAIAQTNMSSPAIQVHTETSPGVLISARNASDAGAVVNPIVPRVNFLEQVSTEPSSVQTSTGSYTLSKDMASRFALLDQHLMQDISNSYSTMPRMVDEKFILKNLSQSNFSTFH